MEKDKDCCCWREGSACIHLCCLIWEMVIRLVGSTTSIRRISVSQSGWQRNTDSWARGKNVTAQPQVTAKNTSQQECKMPMKTGVKGLGAADDWSDYQILQTPQEMFTCISQKQYLPAGNEAVLDTRWPCTLYKSWFWEDAGLMALHAHKIGQNVVQNPITHNFLVLVLYCLFTYNQEIKLFMAITDKLQTSAVISTWQQRHVHLVLKPNQREVITLFSFTFLIRLLEFSGNTAESHCSCSPWEHSNTGIPSFCIAKIS